MKFGSHEEPDFPQYLPYLEIESGSATWAGYPIFNENLDVDMGEFFGWINVKFAPWVYSHDLGTWMYLAEEAVNENGAWAYMLK